MGVPGLFGWLRKKFPKAFSSFQIGEKSYKVNYLYIDANPILHDVAQRIFNYGKHESLIDPFENMSFEAKRKRLFIRFMEGINNLVNIVTPQDVLYVALDGPAPFAKQAQQRERRYKSSKNRTDSGMTFDPNSFTPGTLLMYDLNRYINYSIRKYMNSCNRWKKINVIFSNSNVPGEGEHKIMDYIRTLSEDIKKNKEHCFFGPDGDLIMLTLATHIPKMYLLREDDRHYNQIHFINIGEVSKNLYKNLGLQEGIKTKRRKFSDIVNDFIVEGFFVGNDFLPKIQMFTLLQEGLQLMMKTYANTSESGTKNFLTIKGKLNLIGFKKFIKVVSQYENKYLVEQILTDDERKQPPEPKYVNETLSSCLIDIIEKDKKPKTRVDIDLYRSKYYAKMNINNEDDIKLLCRDYLKTFIWVLEYYINGINSWSHAYKHHYAPLMIDFNEYIQNLNLNELNNISEFDLGTPSLPIVQLLSVLPPQSSSLLPIVYSRLMLDPKSPLVKLGYYPTDFEEDCEGKLKEYQCVALLDFIDCDVVTKHYYLTNKKCLDGKTYKRNNYSNVYLFKYKDKQVFKYTSKMGNISLSKVEKIKI